MALHLCILGIDGSGKSTIMATLPALLAAELELTVASAGEHFQLAAPDEDHLAKDFEPGGLPFTARWARRLKRWAKRPVNNNHKLYPFLKVSQLLCQDAGAWKLARRAACAVSDGNSLLSTMGRAGNCRHEMVCTRSDLLDRRAGFLAWNAGTRLERARYGAHVIRRELEWNEEQFEAQYHDCERFLLSRHALPKMTMEREMTNAEC